MPTKNPVGMATKRAEEVFDLGYANEQILQSDWLRACDVLKSCNLIGYDPDESSLLFRTIVMYRCQYLLY